MKIWKYFELPFTPTDPLRGSGTAREFDAFSSLQGKYIYNFCVLGWFQLDFINRNPRGLNVVTQGNILDLRMNLKKSNGEYSLKDFPLSSAAIIGLRALQSFDFISPSIKSSVSINAIVDWSSAILYNDGVSDIAAPLPFLITYEQ